MLYITTRSQHDAYTVNRALREPLGPDGGQYLPFRMPSYGPEGLAVLREKPFGQCVADVLNTFFSRGLTGWDVECAAGRYPAKLACMNHRLIVAELWHNKESDYRLLEKTLTGLVSGDDTVPAGWVRIAVRIAVLAGVFAQLLKDGTIPEGKAVDVSVVTGDFSAPMAVWYLREMGFPAANIICSCNENSAVWELLQHGQVRTDTAAVPTATPLADAGMPGELERLISGTLGHQEAQRFGAVCEAGGIYAPWPGMLDVLRKGMFATVVSSNRLDTAIPSVYRTGGCIMGPYTAQAYAGLMDYRARTGKTRTALLLADRSPVCDSTFVCGTMGLTEKELKEKLS